MAGRAESAAATSIFVTVGTDHHPFDRLVRWGEKAAAATDDAVVFIQSGTSTVDCTAPHEAVIDAETLQERLATSDVVVCHGGPSTIMEAKSFGHMPIVVPRDPSFGEHVDGHQMRFCDHLDRGGAINLARTEDDVIRLVRQVLDSGGRGSAASTEGRTATLQEISRRIDELCATPRRRLSWLQARHRSNRIATSSQSPIDSGTR